MVGKKPKACLKHFRDQSTLYNYLLFLYRESVGSKSIESNVLSVFKRSLT